MSAPSHKTAIRALRLEVVALTQAAHCSRDDAERDRLAARIADLEHSILALGLAETASAAAPDSSAPEGHAAACPLPAAASASPGGARCRVPAAAPEPLPC